MVNGKLNKNYNLKVFISIATLIIIVIYTAMTLLTSYYISRNGIFLQLNENLQHKEKIIQLLLDERHAVLKRDVEIISDTIDFSNIQEDNELGQVNHALNQIIRNDETIDLAILFDQDEEVVLTSQTGIINYGTTIKYIESLSLNKLISTDYLVDEHSGYIFIHESDQIIDKSTGKLTGHIMLLHLINNNRRLISDIESETTSDRVVIHSNDEILAKSQIETGIEAMEASVVIKYKNILEIDAILGELELVRLNELRSIKVQIELDKNAIISLRNQYLIQFTALLIIIIITVSLVFLLLSKFFNRIFTGINTYTEKVVNGHMDASFEPTRINEINFIGSQIEILANSMIEINKSLKSEIETRIKTEEDLKNININLEKIVEKRTENLANSNKRLSISLDEVEMVKTELEVMNEELQDSVTKLVDTQNELIESEKMAAVGNIVIGISHKFSTPLGISLTASTYALTLIEKIKGLIEKQENEIEILKTVKSTKEATVQIVESVRKLCTMVDELKIISNGDSQRGLTSFNLKDFLTKSMIEIVDWDEDHKYHYSIECDEELMLTSYTDILYQVLRHLLSNAVRHGFEMNDEDFIKIKIEERESEIEIAIEDNGVGIKEEDLTKIFEPYYTTQLGKGKGGLGLYQDYYLVKDVLKGSISCQSEIGVGTTFIIVLNK